MQPRDRSRPSLTKAHSNFGAALTRHKQLDAAIAALTKAVALDPRLTSAYNNLGNALRWAGDYDGALAALHRACELSPHAGGHWLEGWSAKPASGTPNVIHYTRGGPWFEKWRQVDYADLWLREASHLTQATQLLG